MENERSSAQRGPLQRLKTEVFLAIGLLALGLWLVPAAIFLVGRRVFGPYGDIDTLAAFYIDLFGSLLAGNGIAWLLVTSLYLFLSLIRLLVWLWGVAHRAADKNKALAADQANLLQCSSEAVPVVPNDFRTQECDAGRISDH